MWVGKELAGNIPMDKTWEALYKSVDVSKVGLASFEHPHSRTSVLGAQFQPYLLSLYTYGQDNPRIITRNPWHGRSWVV